MTSNIKLALYIEKLLFSPDSLHTPKDKCIICNKKLSENGKYGSALKYCRKLLSCNHWVHVSCQIEKNEDKHTCPVCHKEIIKKEVLRDNIIKWKLIARLPEHYKVIFNEEGIKLFDDPECYKDLVNHYGFNNGFFIIMRKYFS